MILQKIKAVLLTVFLSGSPALATEYTLLGFADLSGWTQDDQAQALQVFAQSCTDIRATAQIPRQDWRELCEQAQTYTGPARAFFETGFLPVRISNGGTALFTGYFEPELRGSRARTDVFRYPLYMPPPELRSGEVWKSRAELESGLLQNRGLELVWLDDPVDAFFVHVQGSARFILRDASIMRVGFAGRNGHPYRSVGRELIRLGLLDHGQASIAKIRHWADENPRGAVLALQFNPSFIFFRELQIDASLGPVGALQYPLTRLRSVAVDPEFTPLGAPVWVAMNGGDSRLKRLMVAQDTGSAVKGAQRADIFYGSGVQAGINANQIRYGGQLVTLLPRETALRLGRTQN